MNYFPGILLFTLLFAATFAPAQEPRGEHAKAHENAAERLEREAEEEKPMPHELLWKLANFAVLAGGLGYLIAKNAGPYFRTRGEDIQQGIVDAAQVRAEAEVRAAAIEKKIGNLSGRDRIHPRRIKSGNRSGSRSCAGRNRSADRERSGGKLRWRSHRPRNMRAWS